MSPKNAIKMINIQKYYLVHIGPIRSTLVFCPLWFYSVHLVLFGPICSYSVYIGPLCPIQFTLVPFGPPCSHSILFCPFGALCSIWSICIHFSPFRPLQFILVHLHTRKDMFRLRIPILNGLNGADWTEQD